MGQEVTHQRRADGSMRQIVSAERLTEILISDGETLERPHDFGPYDDWDVIADENDVAPARGNVRGGVAQSAPARGE